MRAPPNGAPDMDDTEPSGFRGALFVHSTTIRLFSLSAVLARLDFLKPRR